MEPRGLEERLFLPPHWQGDGVIARIDSKEMAKGLSRLNFPTVNISGVQIAESKFPKITTDNQVRAQLAIKHLRDRGFCHFAYFSLRGLDYVAAQRDAFIQAARRAGSECPVFEAKPRHGAEPSWDMDIDQVSRWLKTLSLPTGILVWNAGCGRTVIHAAKNAGLLIPEEIAIISATDDDIFCESTQPPLSAVLVDAVSIGFQAAETLDQIICSGKKPTFLQLVPPLRVVQRQSSDSLAVGDSNLAKALTFIRSHAREPIQVEHVSRFVGLSRRALERKFFHILNRSPAEEIRRLRLERAKELLQDTTIDIPSVARSAGFSSPEYFAHYFKTQTKITPLQFRKKSFSQKPSFQRPESPASRTGLRPILTS